MGKKKNKSGFSLVEIMVATLLLAVLALGGAAALYHTESVIGSQELKRRAIDQAEERMELLKRTRYQIMQPPTPAPDTYYFVDTDQDDLLESGELGLTKNEETQKKFPMISTIKLIPAPVAPLLGGEYLVISVTVTYDQAGQQVLLESTVSPDL